MASFSLGRYIFGYLPHLAGQLAHHLQHSIFKVRIWLRRWLLLVLLLWSCLILKGIGLITKLWIWLMVQFMTLWRILFRSLSLPWEIRLVVPCRVIGIRIRVIPRSRERCVHMLIRIVRKFSSGRTISNMVIGTIAIWIWDMECWNASPHEKWPLGVLEI